MSDSSCQTVKNPCPIGRDSCVECDYLKSSFMGAILMAWMEECTYDSSHTTVKEEGDN